MFDDSCCSWWMSLTLPVNKENTSFYLLHHQLFMIYQYKRNKWLSKKLMIWGDLHHFIYYYIDRKPIDKSRWCLHVPIQFRGWNYTHSGRLVHLLYYDGTALYQNTDGIRRNRVHLPSEFVQTQFLSRLLLVSIKSLIYYYTYSFFYKLRYYCDIIPY